MKNGLTLKTTKAYAMHVIQLPQWLSELTYFASEASINIYMISWVTNKRKFNDSLQLSVY